MQKCVYDAEEDGTRHGALYANYKLQFSNTLTRGGGGRAAGPDLCCDWSARGWGVSTAAGARRRSCKNGERDLKPAPPCGPEGIKT